MLVCNANPFGVYIIATDNLLMWISGLRAKWGNNVRSMLFSQFHIFLCCLQLQRRFHTVFKYESGSIESVCFQMESLQAPWKTIFKLSSAFTCILSACVLYRSFHIIYSWVCLMGACGFCSGRALSEFRPGIPGIPTGRPVVVRQWGRGQHSPHQQSRLSVAKVHNFTHHSVYRGVQRQTAARLHSTVAHR